VDTSKEVGIMIRLRVTVKLFTPLAILIKETTKIIRKMDTEFSDSLMGLSIKATLMMIYLKVMVKFCIITKIFIKVASIKGLGMAKVNMFMLMEMSMKVNGKKE